jgi:uncharacterized protein YdcH (DUF465 family)
MNTEKMMISIPFDEWQEINDKIATYEKLEEKYKTTLRELKDEKLKKRFFYRVGTDAKYEVSVETINLYHETFEESEKFEQMIKEAIGKEMKLRKEYDTEIEGLKAKIENMWKVFVKTPLWLLKLFGLKEKK